MSFGLFQLVFVVSDSKILYTSNILTVIIMKIVNGPILKKVNFQDINDPPPEARLCNIFISFNNDILLKLRSSFCYQRALPNSDVDTVY